MTVGCGQAAGLRLGVFSKPLTTAPSGLTLGISMFKDVDVHAVEIDWRTGRSRSAVMASHKFMDISTILIHHPGESRVQVPFSP
jgi:hypothetical protein